MRRKAEILFRQLKPQFRLDELPGAKPHPVHPLLHATLPTPALSRAFLHALQRP